MESAGIDADDLSRCYFFGAFSTHSDLEAAITIGVFPDLPHDKDSVLKNSSPVGARTLLPDHSRLVKAKEPAERIYCVPFASIPNFPVRMQAAKFLPHTDMSRFPSIQRNLMITGQ